MEPPSRRVRGLVVLDRDASRILTSAALRLLNDDPASVDERKRLEGLMPERFMLDSRPLVVPIGPGKILRDEEVENIDIEQLLHPESSEKFLVAGSIESRGDVPDRLDGAPFFSDPPVRAYRTCGTSRAVGDAADVRAKLDVQTLRANGLDGTGVAIAVVDTGIDLSYLARALGTMPSVDAAFSWTPENIATPAFEHRRGHGTMSAYDALLAAPGATLLDYAVLLGRIDHSVEGTLASAIVAYSTLLYSWKISRSRRMNYAALVVTNSWGIYHPSLDFPVGHPWRFIDNPDHPFRVLVWILARLAGADIVFAAGNCGSDCPAPPCLRLTANAINGAAAYPEVLTVGGCSVDYELVGYSSRGPAIPGMPEPREKPDVVAYTHFYGSEAQARKQPDTGTSASCPIAAGSIAAIRTRLPPSTTSPAFLISTLQETALPQGRSAWNADYGYGVIQPVAAGRALGLIP
jgi:subtilisin family serine protease